jgi:POLQ-like helicase
MKPEARSQIVLSVTQSKAKMYEYNVPLEEHIRLTDDPAKLFRLTIGILGDLSVAINSGNATNEYILEMRDSLRFSAQFFNAFIESHLGLENELFISLLGSTAYYLCDLPGSSNILAERLKNPSVNIGLYGLENLLTWFLLTKNFPTPLPEIQVSPYKDLIRAIYTVYLEFNLTGNRSNDVVDLVNQIHDLAYDIGEPRELLLADLIGAVIRKRIENSTWICLPKYTGLPVSEWADTIAKPNFIREFWPAQHLLGNSGVFKGQSAIVQLPTSAGKTRAAEIIIRSAFLANRISLAVIIAPFRALCHEIRHNLLQTFQGEDINVDELSDVMQQDYYFEGILTNKNIIISTPEKFNYVLRHDPNLAQDIGLIIYDEGHQFDNGSRGITYELLLTSLKTHLLESVQTVLISAVISNANIIGEWLIGDEAVIVEGTNLLPNFRSVGFATKKDHGRDLYFVNSEDPNKQELFVPRVFNQYNLRKKIVFPKLDEGRDIALYLGLKLANKSSSIAIFCGTKKAVGKMCETVTKIYRNGLEIPKPADTSNRNELLKLVHLHAVNFGVDAIATKAAEIGVFSHHNNIPQGIRLAIEFAMKEELINFVICTSTLAQGVNLPIRYLIITSVYQGEERIKVRDFQNLVGRSGRSGMHTEGSILFADTDIYDEHNHWFEVKQLLDPTKSEECESNLLSIFDPIYNQFKDAELYVDIKDLVEVYLQGREALSVLVHNLYDQHLDLNFTLNGLLYQIDQKVSILSAIESYLMSNWDIDAEKMESEKIISLAQSTLAYFLASETQKKQIEKLFFSLEENIEMQIPEISKRIIFGKTAYGTPDSLSILKWLDEHIQEINTQQSDIELLITLWPLIADNIHNRNFIKCNQSESLIRMAISWLEGNTFHYIFQELETSGAKRIAGSHLWNYKIEDTVDICENGFAYEGILLLGALIELIPVLKSEDTNLLVDRIKYLQKR